MSKENSIPLLAFLPILICTLSILFLLDLYRKRNQEQRERIQQFEEQLHQELQQEIDSNEENSDNDVGEGSSTSVHIKKIGKKKGEKLKRKEAKRQYREYLDQQIQARKAQEEILEEQFRRKQLEESIRRADELEKIRKEKAKKAKQEEKEELKKQKVQEKNAKARQTKYSKYHQKIKTWVKQHKFCEVEDLAQAMGLNNEDTEYILKQLCKDDPEFDLCLWSGNQFLFVTRNDYEKFNQDLKEKGKISIHEGKVYY
ncbi:hypothetical protein G6F57_012854 [Rhizopus arrhizus]|nr:hypothetical protein G6F21_010085 [Rhizopus arrhizus]KAG1414993.1 hypothetical protein G6F58_006689 [Rhizopus delemar]KAG0807430.1 hypothetical protein G6F20_010372 [Rhizopus arrhizus]KAG0821666.1 hypothetical protein G6F18_012092 [Rhizopus arrhizus]KAG0837697.1 hypothetical protein G6F19_003532 [Rhizopus arrhizus]